AGRSRSPSQVTSASVGGGTRWNRSVPSAPGANTPSRPQDMKVHIQLQPGPEPLHKGDRAAAPVQDAGCAAPADECVVIGPRMGDQHRLAVVTDQGRSPDRLEADINPELHRATTAKSNQNVWELRRPPGSARGSALRSPAPASADRSREHAADGV